jgi:predicted nucleic acid-binding protein
MQQVIDELFKAAGFRIGDALIDRLLKECGEKSA